MAAIGLAVGAGLYLAATASTAIVLLIFKKYKIASSDISLTPGENDGEFLLKIEVDKKYDAQELLSLLAELQTINGARH